MKPSIGRIVIVRTNEMFNGSDEHPAIVTRVWGDSDPADYPGVCINVTVLPDNAAPFCMPSVPLYESRSDAHEGPYVAWWPSRIA